MIKTKKTKLISKMAHGETMMESRERLKQSSSYLNARLGDEFKLHIEGDIPDLNTAISVLDRSSVKIRSGDTSQIADMLINQSKSLETIFVMMATQANRSESIPAMQAYMHLALKAQNQSRTTLQALVDLLNPVSTQFIKQANISNGHQQVNNFPEKNLTPQNELLEKHDGKWMDRGTKTTTKDINTVMETVDEVHRSKNNRRKVQVFSERS